MTGIFFLIMVIVGIAVFPYRKVFHLLHEHLNVHVFFTGILLTVFSLLFKNVIPTQPAEEGIDAYISLNSAVILNIALFVGVACIVASLFLRKSEKR
ncbi:TPA: hypothetical protein JD192_13110 [Cronobacter sakazakii]|nr:hypothetical protein [Cronobacter sakazakii]